MREIFRNLSAIGGFGYRVLADDKYVKIQERSEGSKFKTKKVMSRKDFDEWSDETRLFDVYNQNPALLCRLCNEET